MSDFLTWARFGFAVWLIFSCANSHANNPGGGDGSGPAVALIFNTNANPPTVTMSNGIVTAVIDTYSSQILQLIYNGNQLTGGGTGGTEDIFWQGQNAVGEQTGAYGILTVITNDGNFAEIQIANLYANQGTTNAYAADAYYYFTMFRGSPGIYVTEDMERNTNAVAGGGDIPSLTSLLWGDFNWLGEDNGRFLLREAPADADAAISGINNAPKEVTLLDQGVLAGQFECKYDFSADLYALHFAGWASTGLTTNIGLWLVHPSREYFSGGPKKPEIVGQFDMINCTFKSVHFGFGSDLNFTNGETWSRVCGPVFFYCNQVPAGTPNPQIALYADAAAQAAAEAGAWPYSWFTDDANYAQASSRGTVTGHLVINDSGNPNASAAGVWVGVEQQPPSSLSPPTTDFQSFGKNYQFWVQTDTNGNFTIPNVIAGTNYTLLAFGPGAIGLYQSQSFGTPAPPVQLYLPPSPFAVTVAGGQTNDLGTVTWTPYRVGATVWEMGVPDRDTTEFRHGSDYWHGDLGNATNLPVNWAQWQDYNIDYPTGVNFIVGQSRWSADWDYAQPTSLDPTTGNLNGTTQNIFFNLPNAPAINSQASIYFAISGDYQGPVEVIVNGVNVTSPDTGFFPPYSCDPMIRMSSHGIFCDYRLNFAGTNLVAGRNEIQLYMRKGGYFSNDIMYDYIRLELTGYVPPAPSSLTAIAGNNVVVLDWPASSGATSYTVWRSATSGGGYTAVATNVIGPVVGSDVPDATCTDTSVVNGATYYYVVSAANPNGSSTNSIQAAATPSASTPPAPSAPAGLTVAPGNLQAALTWNASPGAATYIIQRTVVTGGANANDPGAEAATLPNGDAPTNTVNSFVTGTNYTDTGLANNVTYAYTVSAANANGQSAPSAAVAATTAPALPVPPASLSATITSNLVNLSWTPVANASGYVLQRAASPSGPYTTIDYPAWLSFFTDGPLNYDTTWYYEVASANLAGISSNSAPMAVTLGPGPPASITAVPGNTQVSVLWAASPGATNYVLQFSTTNGGPYTTLLSTTNLSAINSNLLNGTTYYYVVYAVGPYGQSPLSAQASATPFVGSPGVYWINTVTASAQGWNVDSNWSSGTSFPNAVQSLAIINSGISANQTIDLNQGITVGALDIGTSGGSGTFNVAGNGGVLTLDNTPGQATLLQLSTSKGDTISAPVTVNGSLLITNASANTFTLSGSIGGATNGITTQGSVILNGTNTFSGGLFVPAGSAVYPGSFNANNGSWGSGPITFMGGAVQFYGYGGSGGTDWGGCSNAIEVPFGETGTLLLPPRFGYSVPFSSSLTGGGTLNVTVDYVRDFLTGNWSAFTGQINVSVGNGYSTGDFRINNADGYANAAIYLNNGVNFYNINANGQTTDIGELGGAAGAYIGPGSNSSSSPTWRVGARNTTNTYAGAIADASGTSLVKIGTGMLVLTGTNTYTHGTTVNGGILMVNTPGASGTGPGAVTVNSGGTLAGTGIVSGPVSVNSGGALVPGDPLGALTISNNLTLASVGAICFQVEHLPLTNSAVHVTGTLTEGGTLVVTNIGSAALTNGDSFKLLNAAGFSGSFASLVMPSLPPGLGWDTSSLGTNGAISVVVTAHPVISSVTISGSTLTVSGSNGVANASYYLLTTTNLTLPAAAWTRLLTNQFDAQGSFNFTNPIQPNSPQSFYLIKVP